MEKIMTIRDFKADYEKDKDAINKKVIESALLYKDQGECDIWHTIWHNDIPYDYHLILDQSIEEEKHEYEVCVYPVLQDEKGEWSRGVVSDPDTCDVLLYKHTFPDSGEWKEEDNWTKTQYPHANEDYRIMVKNKVHEIKYYMRDVLPISQLLDLREFLNDVIEEEKNVC